jgi:hypothetical protein
MALLLGQAPDDPTAFVNQHFAEHWRENKITPSAKCTDHEFLRRASFDLIGRIPTIPEIDAFIKDAPEQRRRLLIDRLLKHDDAPRHWANVWTDALLGMAGDAQSREAFHDWIEHHFAKYGSHKDLARKLITVTGTTRDNPAGHFFVAYRGQMIPQGDWIRWGQYEMFTVTNQLVRVFHGRRLQCVQCHDHPFNGELRQDQFHCMTAFFRQVEFTGKKVGKNYIDEISDNPDFNKPAFLFYERRNTVIQFSDPKFLDGKRVPKDFKGTRREAVADFLTTSPWFPKAYVHRMWAHFMGHGLCETPDADDLGEHTPVVHEKLLDRLTKAYVASGHDGKALMRWICLSDCYGLSSVANKTNFAPEHAVAFARQQVRPLTNSQLIESLLTASRTPPDERAGQRRAWLKELAKAPLSAAQECEFEPAHSLGDLPGYRMLWMLKTTAERGMVASIVKQHAKINEAAVRDLYLHTLSRPPTPSEVKTLTNRVMYSLRKDVDPDAEEFRRDYYMDVFWALLNSGEFALNH